MESRTPVPARNRLDELAVALPRRAATLSRLFIANTSIPLSRTEIGVLSSLRREPVRITRLAKLEGVTQPAISLLVNRLEQQGWVTREADPADRRAVLVAITPAGEEILDQVRAQYGALLHEEMASLEPAELQTLERAVEILDRLIERLQETGG